MAEPAWQSQKEALGAFIRAQRKLARLSLRELADRTDVSNPYLSQIERGLHEPSVRVLRSIARALNVSAETLLAQAGLLGEEEAAGGGRASPRQATGAPPASTEAAIAADPALSPEQRQALLAVYRSYVAEGNAPAKGAKRSTRSTQATQATRSPR